MESQTIQVGTEGHDIEMTILKTRSGYFVGLIIYKTENGKREIAKKNNLNPFYTKQEIVDYYKPHIKIEDIKI